MNLRNVFKKNKHKSPRAQPKARQDPFAIWLNTDNAKKVLLPSGYTRLSDNQEVKKCIHKIADLVSLMTIMLMSNAENGDIRIKNELSKKLDIYPSKITTRKNFIYRIATQLLTSGNSVVVPILTPDGYFDDFKILETSKLSYHSQDNYNYTINHNGKVLLPDEILHFKVCPDEDMPYIGQGYAHLVKSSIETLSQSTATKRGFLKSEWKPSLIMSVTSDIEEITSPEKRKELLKSYLETTEAGEPWVIPAGEIEIKEVKPLTLNDLAIQDSIELDIKSIASAFGVPPFMVGVGSFNKDEYNNFVSTTILSIATEIQQELTIKLLHSPDLYFKLNQKSLMQYQLTEKMSFVKDMISGGMLNRNEGRNEFDYSPVDNPAMNNYNVLENYIPVDRLGDQKKLKNGDSENE